MVLLKNVPRCSSDATVPGLFISFLYQFIVRTSVQWFFTRGFTPLAFALPWTCEIPSKKRNMRRMDLDCFGSVDWEKHSQLSFPSYERSLFCGSLPSHWALIGRVHVVHNPTLPLPAGMSAVHCILVATLPLQCLRAPSSCLRRC